MAKSDETAGAGEEPGLREPAHLLSDGSIPSVSALTELLEAGSDWLWETDADLRFSWVSDSYRDVTGIDPADVIGRFRFDFLTQVLKGSRSPAAHLDDLQARRPFRDFVYRLKGGRPECRWIATTGFPRFDESGEFIGYRGLGRNVTALASTFGDRETDGETTAAASGHEDAERTMAALNVMNDALCYYDSDDRLVFHNEAMLAIYAGIADKIRPGVGFAEIIEAGLERGLWDTQDLSPADWRQAILDKRRSEIQSSTMIHFADGRSIMHREVRAAEGGTIAICTDVSDHEAWRSELLEAGKRSRELLFDLQRTIDAMTMGIVILDAELNAELVNRAFYDIWKVTPEQVGVGNSFRALMDVNRHKGIYDVVDEGWEDYCTSRLDEIRAGDAAPREFRRADGCVMIYSVTALSGGKRLVTYYDITELKEREAALEQSMRENEVFRSLIDNVPVSIYAKRSDLKQFYVNKGWCDLTGISKEEAIGKTDIEIFGPDGEAFVEGDLAVLRTGETQEIEETVSTADGRVRHQFARKGAMIASDGSLYLIGSTTDITELKQREAELKDAQQRAVLADRAKSEFLANMSHEIRTPMNGVLGMAELLSKSNLDTKQKTFTDIIVKSGNALLTIINDILDFSKIDAGQLVLDPAPFNLAEAIEDVATLVSARAKEKDLELIVRVQPDLDRTFVGDVGRIRQIVTNLLGNAVKFTDKGHVLVDVAGEKLPNATRLSISVTDTGIGIPEDKLRLVFEKFSQVDASSTRRHEGTGLGLAITSRLVDLMGGEMGVESAEGKGSTFWFTLTLPSADQQEGKRAMPIDVTGARVLVVDDNGVNRSILSEQMASWGFDSCAAESGPEGLKVLFAAAAYGVPVDCVVLDYQMPGMSGAEMARIVRRTEGLSETPIVMLTSVDQSLGSASYRDLAIDAHLIKPARSSALLETLVATIQNHHARTKADHIAAHAIPPVGKAEAPAGPQPAEAAAPATPAAHGVDILVAEDNEVNQLVFTQILGEIGRSFEIVGNGRMALDACFRLKPRMILMDVSMPEMSGLEATGEIRRREADEGTHVPIVGVTAHALKGDRERCLEAGMDDYLPKPISPKALSEKVERWLNGTNEARRSA